MTSSTFKYDPKFHGTIPKVPTEQNRPLWSVVIPTHNCAEYLRLALSSVLQQDPGPDLMEIIVVDDHSTKDDPKRVIDDLAGDRVRFIRQSQNVGKARNYETGIAASRGQLVHQLHGDDRVHDKFYSSMKYCFDSIPEAGAAFCESEYINANGDVVGRTGKERDTTGLLKNWLEQLVISQRIQTPGIVVRRGVYEQLGAFDRRLPSFEDWEMWIRIATTYSFAFNAQTLAQYRVYPENTTNKSLISGRRAHTLNTTLKIVDSYLPSELLARCRSSRSRELAQYLTQCIPAVVSQASFSGWLRLCSAILGHRFSLRTLYRILRFTFPFRAQKQG